ncbi:MAG: ABC transporter permease subunit [Chloroflexi bacterium]|nr:ABC transporter permease subunit [Chloroflexota bacterium]
MITHVFNLTRWEWFKLQRRWMPWILLALIVAFSQMPIWGGFFEYRSRVTNEVTVQRWDPDRVFETGLTCAEVRAGQQPALPEDTEPGVIREVHERCSVEAAAVDKAIFTLPTSLGFPFAIGQAFGMLLLSILAVSMLGTEYSWGTLRTLLVKGTGRWQYLTAKLTMVVLFTAGVWVGVTVATVLNSLLATALATAPPPEVAEWIAAHPAAWSDMLVLAGRAFVAVLPYLALAAFVTVMTTSPAAGMAVSLGYYFAEGIGGILLIDVLKTPLVADYLLVRNITGWMLGSKDQVVAPWFLTGPFGIGVPPSQVHAIVVLMAYILLFGIVSFWLFRRRDVTGPTGG